MKSKNEVTGCLDRPVCICDTTLRNGEQAAGVIFSNIEKYRIAQLLDEARIPQIQAGIPGLSTEDKKAVRHIARMGLDASVMSWNRADINDINASIECEVDSVAISIGVSDAQIANVYRKDHEWIVDKIYETVSYASDHGLYISCLAEDAPNADLGFLLDFAKCAREAGADRIGYVDTIGCEDPFTCYERLKTLGQIVRMDYEVISSNDLGMATAHTVAGLKAGARFASVSSMGIGPKAGVAPLEEVVMAAGHTLGLDSGIDCTRFMEIGDAVALASGRPVPVAKPVIGSYVYMQESGVAVDGVVKDENGEAFDPAEVGAVRTVLVGKHSSRNTIISEIAQMGIELSREDADALLDMVRKATIQMHRSVSPKELFLLYEDLMSGNDVFDEGAVAVAPAPAAAVPEPVQENAGNPQ